MKFGSEKQKWHTLSLAKNLNNLDDDIASVSITKDMSKEELQAEKALKKELHDIIQAGESCKIKNGKIIKVPTQRVPLTEYVIRQMKQRE